MLTRMEKKHMDRYECAVVDYLTEIGHVERIVKFQYGFECAVAIQDEEKREYNHRYYTFEFQGNDRFLVYYKWVDFDDAEYEGDGFGPEYTEDCGVLEVK